MRVELPGIALRFRASGGAGPITWGQCAMWQAMRWLGEESHFFNLQRVIPVPPGRSAGDVAGAMRALVERHHALRTRFPGYGTDPVQDVAEHGTMRLAVHAATAQDAERIAAGLSRELAGRAFHQDEDEWPVRAGLVLADGHPAHLVLAFSHLIVDGASLAMLMADLASLLGGELPVPPEPGWNPLSLAGYEQSAAGRARHDAAMRYWRTELRDPPLTIFDVPVQPHGPARFCELRMVSRAVAAAAKRVASASQCTTSAVVLAAYTAILAHYTGHSRIPLQVISSNRWRPQTARTIATTGQNGLFTVALRDMPFGEFAQLVWKRALMCYQAAAYDPAGLIEVLVAANRFHGAIVDNRVLFNDTRVADGWPEVPETAATVDALTALGASTRIERTGQWKDLAPKLCLTLLGSHGHATADLQVDTAFVPESVGRQILSGMQALLIRAAVGPVSLSEIGGITGIVPAERGDGWIRVHGTSWVDLAEVVKVVAAAQSVAAGTVVTERDPAANGDRLVAYLVPAGPGTTVEQVHDEVVRLIDWRTDVVAPKVYHLCAGPPRDGGSWQSQPVVASGSGRGPVMAW
jgi:condensation domain-containing protein